jgi:REP-associated tyrosine transposase
LFSEDDYAQYGGWLAEAADGYGCRIDACVFMTNHVHLLVTPEREDSLPRTLQSRGVERDDLSSNRHPALVYCLSMISSENRYPLFGIMLKVRTINTAYRRTGTLWEGRTRGAPIDSEAYFLACCRHVELKAVRARMVRHRRDDHWSGFRAHADGRTDPSVGDHPVYRALGRGAEARQSAHRALFRGALESGFVNAHHAATNGGWALGTARFARQIEAATRRRAAPRLPGRPQKQQRGERRQLALLRVIQGNRTLTPISHRGRVRSSRPRTSPPAP